MAGVKIWMLESEFSVPELWDKVSAEVKETLANFRLRLEREEVLDWKFDFWDVEDQRRMRKKVERLNDVCANVYVIPTVSTDSDSFKRRRLEDGSHVDRRTEPLNAADPLPHDFVVLDEVGEA